LLLLKTGVHKPHPLLGLYALQKCG
jgi:hypothetical protein